MPYFSSFLVSASCGNLSLQHVNSKNCTVRFGFGEKGVLLLAGFLGCIVCMSGVLHGICNGGGSMGGATRGWCCLVFFLCIPCIKDYKALICGVGKECVGQYVYCLVMSIGAEIIYMFVCATGEYVQRIRGPA